VPGYTPSEQLVGESLDMVMSRAEGRMIVATFASLISRVQQVIDAAGRHNRRVFVTGRSMIDNVQMALDLGYLDDPNNLISRIEDLRGVPPHEVVIMSTGSQGEPTSALARMANQDHRWVEIMHGDTVVLSSSPIPGNEQLVNRVVDNLFKLGAEVYYNRVANVHVRGHAAQEELKLILSLVKPRFFVPIHGEYRHLTLHTRLAQAMGMTPDQTWVLEDGDMLEIRGMNAELAGRAPATNVYVDGLGVGDVDQVVLRDRRHLATDGMVVVIVAVERQTGRLVGRPDVVSRGFVDIEESADLLEQTRDKAAAALDGADHMLEWSVANTRLKDVVARFLHEQTRRRPMVLPVSVEV
jgi:ribonuclease J